MYIGCVVAVMDAALRNPIHPFSGSVGYGTINSTSGTATTSPFVVTIPDLLSTCVTASAILIGAATFIMGLYLAEKARGVDPERLETFQHLVVTLAFPAIMSLAIALITTLVIPSAQIVEMLLVVVLFLAAVPPVALLVFLRKGKASSSHA